MHRTSRICALAALALALAAASPAQARKVTHTQAFGDGKSLATSLWIPDSVSSLRGVAVFTGGQSGSGSGDTRGLADNRFWQRFGESLGFAILGTQFSGAYTDASSGPGMALLDSLQAYATDTSHPELANAPLLLEGFSNGGYFSFTFAHWKPERTIAFCVNKSGFASAPLDAAFLAVPGFLIWGSEEPANNVPSVIHSLVQKGRGQHALWAELREWGAQHEEGSAERAFAPFFAEMVAARYPQGATPKDGPVKLLALDETSGWLADHSDDSVSANVPTAAAWDDYKADRTAASWLPSEGLAYLWRGFVTKSPLTLGAPAAASQADATQPLALSASGLDAADEGSFADGAARLAEHVKPSGGQATASWTPAWGGVRGIVGLSSASTGTLTRLSRPAHIVLYGKDAPGVAQPPAAMPDAGVAADSGMPDAGMPAPRAGSGAAGRKAPEPAADSGAPADADTALAETGSDAGALRDRDAGAPFDASPITGGCSCAVTSQPAAAETCSALGWLLALAALWRRARR